MSVLHFKELPPIEPPALQPGDPGAEPPPANLEPVPQTAAGAAAELVAMATESMMKADRFQLAFASMLCGLTSMCNLTIAAAGDLRPEDLPPLKDISGGLVQAMQELSGKLQSTTIN